MLATKATKLPSPERDTKPRSSGATLGSTVSDPAQVNPGYPLPYPPAQSLHPEQHAPPPLSIANPPPLSSATHGQPFPACTATPPGPHRCSHADLHALNTH